MSTLTGKRIVITRPRQQGKSFARKLEELGAIPVFLPTIEIAPLADNQHLDRALSRLESYDWLILTSVNAVKVVLERLNILGINRLPAKLQLAAVGPKTSMALARRGLQPNFVPPKYIAEEILPGLGDLQGRWVLLPLADIAHQTLPDRIAKADGVAHVVTAYHTVPAEPNPAGLAALRAGVDAITFSSSSTVRNFVRLARKAGLNPFDLPGKPANAYIGPKTAATAEKMGLSLDVIAQEYTLDGLLAALQDAFA